MENVTSRTDHQSSSSSPDRGDIMARHRKSRPCSKGQRLSMSPDKDCPVYKGTREESIPSLPRKSLSSDRVNSYSFKSYKESIHMKPLFMQEGNSSVKDSKSHGKINKQSRYNRSSSSPKEKRRPSPSINRRWSSASIDRRRSFPLTDEQCVSLPKDKRSSWPAKNQSPIKVDKTRRVVSYSSLRDNISNDYMKIKVTVKRRRSSSSSSDDPSSRNVECEKAELSPKRKRLSECSRSSSTPSNDSSKNVFRKQFRSFVAVPDSSTLQSSVGHSHSSVFKSKIKYEDECRENTEKFTRRSDKRMNSSNTYTDGNSSKYEDLSDRENFKNEGFQLSPSSPVRRDSMAPTSDLSSHSFLTPRRPSSYSSPRDASSGNTAKRYSSPKNPSNSFGSTPSSRYSSPSFNCCSSPGYSSPSPTSFFSPRSTLKGLDQPQPWARDLVARSESYHSVFVDSHCHIDLLYDRLGINHSKKFDEFRRMVACSFPVNYEGCVAVFCYPKTYDPENPQNKLLQTLAEDEDIWFALGCHPKSALEFTPKHAHSLREALGNPKVVALGEIGLDYSGTFHRHAATQKAVLKLQLHMAVDLKLPLVIHCRDAYDDCLAILMEIVPRSWRIHLHCFCGNMEVASLWMKTFPNLYIGLTPVITYRSASDIINTVQFIPMDRVLLETDSPYFVPGSLKGGMVQVSHPGFALFTAERIAELKNVPVDTVLKACRMNTQHMYGI